MRVQAQGVSACSPPRPPLFLLWVKRGSRTVAAFQFMLTRPKLSDDSVRASCPICLGEPVGAKITRCGHIYCWHCILHHLEVGSSSGLDSCPICEDAVYWSDLRSVIWRVVTPPKADDTMTMRLLKRERCVQCVQTERFLKQSCKLQRTNSTAMTF